MYPNNGRNVGEYSIYMEPLGYIWTLEKNLAESDECWSVASPWFPVNTMVHAAPIAWFNYAILLAVFFLNISTPQSSKFEIWKWFLMSLETTWNKDPKRIPKSWRVTISYVDDVQNILFLETIMHAQTIAQVPQNLLCYNGTLSACAWVLPWMDDGWGGDSFRFHNIH